MYFIYLYKNRTMKAVEIILSRGEGVMKKDGGDESDKDSL
jgi:hypothetical protein